MSNPTFDEASWKATVLMSVDAMMDDYDFAYQLLRQAVSAEVIAQSVYEMTEEGERERWFYEDTGLTSYMTVMMRKLAFIETQGVTQ